MGALQVHHGHQRGNESEASCKCASGAGASITEDARTAETTRGNGRTKTCHDQANTRTRRTRKIKQAGTCQGRQKTNTGGASAAVGAGGPDPRKVVRWSAYSATGEA